MVRYLNVHLTGFGPNKLLITSLRLQIVCSFATLSSYVGSGEFGLSQLCLAGLFSEPNKHLNSIEARIYRG